MGGAFSADVSGVDNLVAHDGDTCAIWFFFFGAELADYFGEGDTLALVARDILKADDAKGVGAFGALSSTGWPFADALA